MSVSDQWLKAPDDRDVIARWSGRVPEGATHALALPPPADPSQFEFLALGDTGDSGASSRTVSPQDAVAREMAADAALPGCEGAAELVLHLGDVVYMTGEKRLYDRNFRRPYAPFLAPDSTIDRLVFRLPFLPVPGNHDYYDLGLLARLLVHVPFLGAGLRAVSHELFAFDMPESGSDMGRAWMEAFVDAAADTTAGPLAYQPYQATRVPHRYYRFTYGCVDFFALDSNTLNAPPPATDRGAVRAEAGERLAELEKQSHSLNQRLRREQLALDRWRAEYRREVAADPARREALAGPQAGVAGGLNALAAALAPAADCQPALRAVETAGRRWREASDDLARAASDRAAGDALDDLEEASDAVLAALRALEPCLGALPDGPARTALLAAREALDQALCAWCEVLVPTPPEVRQRLHDLSEDMLDVQRELALERRRRRARPEDHDTAQFRWLAESLSEAERERPSNWRIVYLHHPLYTTIGNHCEKPDVVEVRENLAALLRDRVHLILAGHSHAFEWFRSRALGTTPLIVSGGGGQVSLRRSILDRKRFDRHEDEYRALRESGVEEYLTAGRGPAADDGEDGNLYHYLRVQVSRELIRIVPVGVRRLGEGRYRREEPLPVHYTPHLPEGRPPFQRRLLDAIEIRRAEASRAVFVE